MARYRRVLVTLSGGAFSGPVDFGFDKAAVDAVHSIPQRGSLNRLRWNYRMHGGS